MNKEKDIHTFDRHGNYHGYEEGLYTSNRNTLIKSFHL